VAELIRNLKPKLKKGGRAMKTKGAIVLLISLMLVVVSCAGLQPEETAVASRIAARHLSKAIAEKYPETRDDMISTSETALEALESAGSAELRTDLLELTGIFDKIDDPVLREDLKDVLTILGVGIDLPIPQLDENRKMQLKAVLKGINQGATMSSE
jgi:hypothetical protein